ncbi:MAG: hypothetical protein NT077_04540 [Candidatus Taylorbacteria bacterium]|nr:hypothetical protein [Candidatus Taylorbacteria bacterium]
MRRFCVLVQFSLAAPSIVSSPSSNSVDGEANPPMKMMHSLRGTHDPTFTTSKATVARRFTTTAPGADQVHKGGVGMPFQFTLANTFEVSTIIATS